MEEIKDSKKIRTKLQVIEVSYHSLFPLTITNNKVINHISKFDLYTEIHITIFESKVK